MSSDIAIPARDELIPVKQAADILPRKNGKKIHTGTLWRYVLNGRRGVKMQSVLVGGARYVTEKWVWEFIHATSGSTPAPAPSASRTPSRRNRAVERAAAELNAAGI